MSKVITLKHQESGERHDDFRGQGNAGRFYGHQQHDAGIAHGGDDAHDPGGD